MSTNLAISDRLINDAKSICGLKTKKETVTLALEEFIQRKKQEQIIELFGKIDFNKDYDYKKARYRKIKK